MEEKDAPDTGSLGAAPGYEMQAARKMLVLAPHPDDETLGCGGTIALCASGGAEVRVVIVSDGGKISPDSGVMRDEVVRRRKQEAEEASIILGIARTYFLGFPDGELQAYKTEIEEGVREIVSGFAPDVILSPSPVDYHADHIAVSEIARAFLTEDEGVKVAFYEVYETIRFNTLVDISSVADIKEKAILQYRNSLFNVPEVFAGALRGFNRFRSIYPRQTGLYEAFLVTSRPFSTNELVSWVTYGVGKIDPATLFLSKIKAVDEAFFELRKCAGSLRAKEDVIRELEETLEKDKKQIDALEERLDAVHQSLVWRLALRFFSMRDRVLPQDTPLRRIYDRIMTRVKSDKPEGK
jgi:LmbE family N-acetylglucosaminyl deacetylase